MAATAPEPNFIERQAALIQTQAEGAVEEKFHGRSEKDVDTTSDEASYEHDAIHEGLTFPTGKYLSANVDELALILIRRGVCDTAACR